MVRTSAHGFPGVEVSHAVLVPDSLSAAEVHGAPASAARPVHDAVARWPVEVPAVQSSAAKPPAAASVLNAVVASPVLPARGLPALVAPGFAGLAAAWLAHRTRDVVVRVASVLAGVAAAWPGGQIGWVPVRFASELGGVVGHESDAPGSGGSNSDALLDDRGR